MKLIFQQLEIIKTAQKLFYVVLEGNPYVFLYLIAESLDEQQ